MLQLAPTASLLSDAAAAAVAARRAAPISIGEKHQLFRSLVMAEIVFNLFRRRGTRRILFARGLETTPPRTAVYGV